jgi:iron(III) transport system permease protein
MMSVQSISGSALIRRLDGRSILSGWPWAQILLVAVIISILAFLIVNPVVRLGVSAFQTPSGRWTLENFAIAYGDWRSIVALWNSFVIGAFISLGVSVIALPLAWGVARTDMPLRSTIRVGVLAAFITPPYLAVIGWILLLSPNAGWLNRLSQLLFGSSFADIYSLPALVFTLSLSFFPYLFLMTIASLELVSSDLEEAASISGASKSQTIRRVTLPLVLPPILGGLMITFLEAVTIFGPPALIAIPGNFDVLTTQLWQFFSFPPHPELAAAYALPLLAVIGAMLWAQSRLLGRRSFSTVHGKGGHRTRVALGRWRWPLASYGLAIIGLAVVLPYFALGQAAFARAWGRGLHFDNFTFANFHYVLFVHSTAARSIFNSVFFSAAAATFAIALALAIAYLTLRKPNPVVKVLPLICMVPFVVPGIVFAIGLYTAYAPPPWALAGTSLLMITGFSARFLPTAYAACNSALRSLNPELEEAVQMVGGSRFVAFRRIVVPTLKRNLVAAWLLVFITSTQELSAAMFLYGPSTRTMSITLFDLSEEGHFEQMAALGCLLLATTIVIAAIGQKMLGDDVLNRWQS